MLLAGSGPGMIRFRRMLLCVILAFGDADDAEVVAALGGLTKAPDGGFPVSKLLYKLGPQGLAAMPRASRCESATAAELRLLWRRGMPRRHGLGATREAGNLASSRKTS